MAVHNILIIGANFGGIGAAHYLLRHTIPTLEARDQSTTYKVTLISPSSQFFWKIGAPRTLASPDLLPISKAFASIEDGFKDYPSDHFELVLGSATHLDESRKIVTIEPLTSTASVSYPYSTLIIATGTTSTSPLWTLHGSHEKSIEAFQELHKSLPDASSILIAGGGPAGTETAGEIGTLYPKANITILSGTKSLLPRLPHAVGAAAQSKLAALGVKTRHDVKVNSETRKGSKTVLELSDGTTESVDVYIDATGGRPNSSFLPKSWLNDRGYVITDPKTLRGPTEGVYAIGDVASYSAGGVMDVLYGMRPLCSSILIDLSGTSRTPPKQLQYKPMKDTQIVPIGPKGGVGSIMGWKIPSLMVWAVKSRTFMVEKVPGVITGKDYMKA
ncbi:hypothetical protein MMC07_002525 [Pseudocyphellaria aurata]|nr:hypothetical protein [Pseudocyphellaria aurata]